MARDLFSEPFSPEQFAGGPIPYTQPLSEGVQNAFNEALPGLLENPTPNPEI
jgi:hypothetical protein